MSTWQENVLLAPYTTVGLGGPARYFVTITSVEELQAALEEAQNKDVRVHILAGGSNTIFSDAGFAGLVIKMNMRGVEFVDDGKYVLITAQAGELWEPLVAKTVIQNLAGFECLSGIPGSVGGTPVQNVGAYGQEVSQTITHVTALDCQSRQLVEFSNSECQFAYRMSRFKVLSAERYVIVAVQYRLRKDGAPTLVYQQVIDEAGENPSLAQVREVVLRLRRSKSMVWDESDPHAHSCGSFFTNPTLSSAELAALSEWAERHAASVVPHFPAGDDRVTVPAAWFIEQAGWRKGWRQGGVGISANHPLALVNYGGTTTELLALATEIELSVKKKFGIVLMREPVVVV